MKRSSLWKTWLLCASINWPSYLVNSASFKCSDKVREKFFMWKRTITLHLNLGSYEFPLFVLFFNLLFCCPMSNFWDVVQVTGSIIQCQHCVILLIYLLGQKFPYDKVESWPSAQRSLKWEHSNSYIIPHSTDLLSFNSQFCQPQYVNKF